MNTWELAQKMSLPFEAKKAHAIIMAREFYERLGGDVYVGLGGLDSITLLLFVRKYINKSILGAAVSVLEDKSIQEVHQLLGNAERIKRG